MRFASLGSGSRGNGLVVESGRTRVLLDCGFSLRETAFRLGRLDVEPAGLAGILVTHEHSDHLSGVVRFAARHGLPVWLTAGTALNLPEDEAAYGDLRRIDSHEAFAVGDLEVQPFPVPHDAQEPVQYRFSNGDRYLGVLTDCGSLTPHLLEVLQRCHGLVLECNHDAGLLAASAYPAFLKRRIAGSHGHLANAQAASLLAQVETIRLRHVVAAHLSEKNNHPNLAVAALAGALDCAEDWIGIADQKVGFDWRDL